MTVVTVTAYPRLHIGLLDLGSATSRIAGGAGFALRSPKTSVELEKAAKFECLGPIDAPGRKDVLAVLERSAAEFGAPACRLTIHRMPPQHAGFGSKTSLLLAAAAAVAGLQSISATETTLRLLSGRGGTSGVGVYAFFIGGFVADAGRPAGKADRGPDERDTLFQPSSAVVPKTQPTLVARYPVSERWVIELCMGPGGRIFAQREREFFRVNTPLPGEDIVRSIAALYHDVIPAIIEEDLDALADGLRKIHSTGFKKRELSAQAMPTIGLYKYLSEQLGLPAGLSSLGPLVYALHDQSDDTISEKIRKRCEKDGITYLGQTRPHNAGYRMSTSAEQIDVQ
jgi:beta-ribofuranosylaminobenzene 5'-phosphate synthase